MLFLICEFTHDTAQTFDFRRVLFFSRGYAIKVYTNDYSSAIILIDEDYSVNYNKIDIQTCHMRRQGRYI